MKMFLAFHDLSTAFDHIGRNGRFYLLWQNGIHGKWWKIYMTVHSNVSSKAVFGKFETTHVEQDFGVM